MSENTKHKLDHKLKAVKSEDPIWHLHEYDVDLQSNHIYLFGMEMYQAGQGDDGGEEPGIEYTIANRFIRNMNLCMRVNPDRPILIHMKSNGGTWEEGMAIYDCIKSCPFPVTILNYTHARSMTSIILQAANKRVMMPHSSFMFHDGTIGMEGTVKTVISALEFGKITDQAMMEIYVDTLKLSGKFVKRSGKWIKRWLREQMDQKEDVYLTAKQAVELGFADEIFNYDWKKLTEYNEAQMRRG